MTLTETGAVDRALTHHADAGRIVNWQPLDHTPLAWLVRLNPGGHHDTVTLRGLPAATMFCDALASAQHAPTLDPRIRVRNYGPGNWRTLAKDPGSQDWPMPGWTITGPPHPTKQAAIQSAPEAVARWYGPPQEFMSADRLIAAARDLIGPGNKPFERGLVELIAAVTGRTDDDTYRRALPALLGLPSDWADRCEECYEPIPQTAPESNNYHAMACALYAPPQMDV